MRAEDPVARPRTHARARAALGERGNWMQLAKFVAVGGSGYALNLTVFTLGVVVLGVHHLIAASLAFVVAVSNNFWWNRHWTFAARAGHAGGQAARYLTVSLAAFVIAAALLELLISGLGLPKVPAQALSVGSVTPLNFLANKLWSFRRRG
jgi:putative flippase GtrA